ncbi:prephenate dehydratase [Microaerobacter geothermalis]|uniref:prephenate dehydratase n=1 Tax=Microaerobacter geothermalis TaxID=674972 RepID=UPI001F3AB350|nr:prephenate dehydratase [Microaerobacter geothermalis]MCF6092725.1 prephenate dehydratase [Microaerobacter geothermalis]
MRRRIAFLGPRGTFTEEAARAIFPDEDKNEWVPRKNIADCLETTYRKETDFGVVPIENSIEGSVNLTLDWLIHEVNLPILAEMVLPITQHLLVAKREIPITLNHVEKVYSHPHAVAQCHHFLRECLPHVEVEYTNSTAEAAQFVANSPEKPWAAIGTSLAEEIYPLKILHHQIQDHTNNYTRFILVGEENAFIGHSEKQKTSILVTLPSDFPGALYQVLAAFAWRKINLSRIESRPTKKGLGSYHFLIDIEQGMDDVLLPGAFAEIEAIGCEVRYLGTYPCFMVKESIVKNKIS